MKTTVEIADALFEEARRCAAARKATFRDLVEEGLRAVVKREKSGKKAFRLRDGSFGGEGLRESLSWADIRERIYSGRGE